ncbi:TPA: DUF1642 domain-containing protein [Listeria monocytogenes]|uniref:Gp35 protein n=3 Tax=root TaxID=1 RepID=Q8W5X2_9CAUD|nr:DUF1642 domain-containing protein [Listeria monocytogenes]NP_511018.1 DUF1642 domain-containing protein [Listeria phage PSA]YP_008126737.1 DUF1642 domain-containing protein [Listeria phage LP-030-2]MCZ19008.1 DUF1642 domain-containing protein [Listeria monocytogenes serotype 4b]AFN39979.1 DUF1642 domain containing protein [Listeria phage LP-030-2]AQY44498.1 hypothetical protein DC57_09430 [Listeria monocytogenes]AVV12563.1 DUF1642 domain-containing protein [Listeria monocytogenes]AXO75333
MKFRKGDKVEFIWSGKLKQGVVTEIEETKNAISYQIKYSGDMGMTWLDERDLIAPAQVLKVPQFVADWIEQRDAKGDDLYTAMDKSWQSMNYKVIDWLEEGEDRYNKFARAWLDGYEVEKEPLYYVRLPLSTWNDDAAELEVINMYVLLNIQSDETTFTGSIINKNKKWKTKLTEAEIKGMPGGDIYWQFAVPVEEVEGEA